ncbi:hypothetical protein [Ruminococcus flavefaciens]|uniref:hypothetical protein n=1 Tax=Ruminococcus flavefaciens TaxID=1265 RepID=UPI000464955D|nr:hypothetical protein [Ruminococcus flavefaciens]
MMLLLRKRDVSASTTIDDDVCAEYSQTVSLDKVRELLQQVKQLNNCRLNFRLKRDGNIVLRVNDVTYQTTDD